MNRQVGQHAEDSDAQIGGRQIGEKEVGHRAHLSVSSHDKEHQDIAWNKLIHTAPEASAHGAGCWVGIKQMLQDDKEANTHIHTHTHRHTHNENLAANVAPKLLIAELPRTWHFTPLRRN